MLSDIAHLNEKATALPYPLECDATDYYHRLTRDVQEDGDQLMRVLAQCFNCISNELSYLSGMLMLKKSDFVRHADYVPEFRTCVIQSKVNVGNLQIFKKNGLSCRSEVCGRTIKRFGQTAAYCRSSCEVALWKALRLPCTCKDHCRSVYCSWLLTRGSPTGI